MENVPVKLMVNVFNREKEGKLVMVEEMCEMMANVVCFMEDS